MTMPLRRRSLLVFFQASALFYAPNALADGTADTYGTDHAPHTLEEKGRGYVRAPSGFPGLETSVGVLCTFLHSKAIDLHRLVDLSSANAARIFDLDGFGSLDVGTPADLTCIDPMKTWTVDPAQFETKAKYSPFEGMQLTGVAVGTMIDGHMYWRGT